MKSGIKQTIIVNNLRLTYYRQGTGKPLLFLHGGRVRAHTFHKVITQLAKKYTVLAPDIPGYGDSETPKDVWSFTEYADFFDSFLRQLNIKKVTVMGYSLGGGIASNLAGRSNYISRLILIDSAGLPPPNAKPSHHDVRRLGFYLTHPRYFSVFRTLVSDFSRFVWKHRRDWRHIKAIRHQCFITQYDAALSNIKVPTEVIWGSEDWVLPEAIAHEFKKHISQARIQIVKGNHDWLLYNPSQLADVLPPNPRHTL